MKEANKSKSDCVVPSGEAFEVFEADNSKKIVALVYEVTTNTLTQEGYSLWIQLQQDWLRVSSSGLVIRPAKKRAATEEQFRDMAEAWIKKCTVSRAWVIKHFRQTPMIYSLDNDILDPDELESIPSPVFEAGSVKMAVPAGRFLVSKPSSKK